MDSIVLTTEGFLGKLVSKILTRAINKKLGKGNHVKVNAFNLIEKENDQYYVYVEASGVINKNVLEKLKNL